MKIFSQVMVLFSLVAVGYICKRLRLISNDMNRDVSNLLVYVALPALIIVSLTSFPFSTQMFVESGKLLALSFSLYSLYIFLSFIFPKILGAQGTARDIFQFAIVFGNTGFIGFPVAHALFGEKGVFYMAIFDIFFYVFVWTFGVMVLSRHQGMGDNPGGQWGISLKQLLNPNILAVLIGFALFLASAQLPAPVHQSLALVGSITTPLAMIFIGSTLADMELSKILDSKVIFCSLGRLVLLPLIVLIALKMFKFDGYLLSIPVLYSAMPVAASSSILAAKYGNDHFLASRLIFVSTLLSIVTIPMIAWILG